MGHSRPLFLCSSFQHNWQLQMFDKSLPMIGFEPQISGVGGNRSTDWATTTALLSYSYTFLRNYNLTYAFLTTFLLKIVHCFLSYLIHKSVWPDWTIYWTLSHFLKPIAKINLPKSPAFLGNFCKGVKNLPFLGKSFLGNFYRNLATFYWSHWQMLTQIVLLMWK